MNAFALLAGAASIATLLSAILLDSVNNARGGRPAPKAFTLFLAFFLALQILIFIGAAMASEPKPGSDPSRLVRFFAFILEDFRLFFSAILVWYLPRFLFASLNLSYTKTWRRAFLFAFALIGISKALLINAQALAYWMDSWKPFLRQAYLIDDAIGLPLFYASATVLFAKASRGLGAHRMKGKVSYFWGKGFLALLSLFLLADLGERIAIDPVLSGFIGIADSSIFTLPCVSLSGFAFGLYVSLKAAAAIKAALGADLNSGLPRGVLDLKDYSLTQRETEIASLLVRGYVNKEIAQRFGISYGTVKNHVYSLFKKLGIGSRFELMKLAESTSPASPL